MCGIVKDLTSTEEFVLLHKVYWEADVLKTKWQIGIVIFSALHCLLVLVSTDNVHLTFRFTDAMFCRL